MGDHLFKVNQYFGKEKNNNTLERLYLYNRDTLDAAGCSIWLPKIAGKGKTILSDFYKGTNIAYKNYGKKEKSHCVKKLVEYGIINN